MRALPILLMAFMIAPLASAQPMVEAPHEIRIAYGDLPSTEFEENTERWNVRQTLRIPEGGNASFTIPGGHDLEPFGCDDDCRFESSKASDEDIWTITCLNGRDDATCVMQIQHFIPGSIDAFGLSMFAHGNTTVLVYTIDGLAVTSNMDNVLGPEFYFPGSDPALLIHQFDLQDERIWLTVSPADQTAVIEDGISTGPSIWLGIFVGLVIGAGAWYLLVRQGIVQKRQRKQVAGTAAHKDVASKEDKATLEWRRRALLAAMKELELARADQSIDLAAYDTLKADFKRQTVTVMRALEELGE